MSDKKKVPPLPGLGAPLHGAAASSNIGTGNFGVTAPRLRENIGAITFENFTISNDAVSVKLSNGIIRIGNGPPEIGIRKPDSLLGAGERGLVVSPRIYFENDTLHRAMRFDPQQLRSDVLFWDRLDWPLDPLNTLPFALYSIEEEPDVALLKNEGVLTRTEPSALGVWNGRELALEGQLASFRVLNHLSPGQWALSRGEQSLSYFEAEPNVVEMEEDRAVMLSLYDALPVPSAEVPMEKLLEFKLKRDAELQALREHLDRIYQTILAAPDRPLAESTEVSALDRAIADYIKAIDERKFPLALSSPKVKMKTLGGAAAVAGIADLAFGLPITQSILAGALYMGKEVIGEVEIKAAPKKYGESGNPFEYIGGYRKLG